MNSITMRNMEISQKHLEIIFNIAQRHIDALLDHISKCEGIPEIKQKFRLNRTDFMKFIRSLASENAKEPQDRDGELAQADTSALAAGNR